MENQNKTPDPHQTYDETKIYTPRYASQMKAEQPPCVLLDHAPVRIYKRPLKHGSESIQNDRATF